MKRFEYFTGWLVAEHTSLDEEQHWLNGMGEDGWELVSTGQRKYEGVASVFYYFKREILDGGAEVVAAPRFDPELQQN